MADAIYAIVEYPSIYETLSREGRNEVNQITWDKAGLKVRKIYDAVVNS
jgi:glycosyltransferase involved in cell wall biosynthesis